MHTQLHFNFPSACSFSGLLRPVSSELVRSLVAAVPAALFPAPALTMKSGPAGPLSVYPEPLNPIPPHITILT